MTLNVVTTGNTVLAADINQLVNVLQQQSGSTEVGKYYLAGWGGTTGDKIMCCITSLSRNSTPVSVTIDTAIVSPTNVTSPITTHLTSCGFAIETTTTGATVNGGCGGNYTLQYALLALSMSATLILALLGYVPHIL